MNTLFENYESFLNENADDLSSPHGAIKMLRDNGAYRDFTDCMLEGISDFSQRQAVSRILDRQRESVLEEAANVSAGGFTHGWAVLSFPILVDIYAEPIISQVMNLYPVSSPTLSIPRVRIKSTIQGYDGQIEETAIMPTPHKLIRAGFKKATCPVGHSNLFTLAGVDPQGIIMNRRYTIVDGVMIKASKDSEVKEFTVPCSLQADSRDTVSGQTAVVNFVGPEGTEDAARASSVQLSINFNYNNGTITNQATLTVAEDAEWTYEYVGCTVSLKFVAKNSDKGRVLITLENSMQDITIDPNEDFQISLTSEELQDYKSIFKIDLARTLSEAIKRQILLNKDFDLAYFLKASEADMAANNAIFNVDLSNYNAAGSSYVPNNIYDVMKGLIPYISAGISQVYRNFQLYPYN